MFDECQRNMRKANISAIHFFGRLSDMPYLQFQELYEESGVFGFWKGVIPALIMVSHYCSPFLLLIGFTMAIFHNFICYQVSNPAIQFMLYETLLKKLKKRRASNLKGADGLTALEVSFCGLKLWTYCKDDLRACLSGTYIIFFYFWLALLCATCPFCMI